MQIFFVGELVKNDLSLCNNAFDSPSYFSIFIATFLVLTSLQLVSIRFLLVLPPSTYAKTSNVKLSHSSFSRFKTTNLVKSFFLIHPSGVRQCNPVPTSFGRSTLH